MNTETLDRLQFHVEGLKNLLTNREPGNLTWWEAILEQWKRIAEMWDNDE